MQAQQHDTMRTAQQLLQQGDYAAAVELLAPLARDQAGDPALWRLLGVAQLRGGAGEAALESFERALRISPNDPDVHKDVGVALAEVGPRLELDSLVRTAEVEPRVHGDHVHGEIRMVDHFGNLALNVRRFDQASIATATTMIAPLTMSW